MRSADGHSILQNAPYIFTTVWSVIKGWLDPVTVEKIKILGSGYEKELKEHVSWERKVVARQTI